MAKVDIDKERCKGCLLCISVCPKGAIIVDDKFNKRGIKPVKFKKGQVCAACTMCAIICPECCIEISK